MAEARENWDDAQKYLESLLVIDPKDTGAMQRLARVLFQQKHADKCLEKLNEAYDVDAKKYPNDPDKRTVPTPELGLGQLYAAFPDPKNAKIWMKRALAKIATAGVPVHEQVNTLVNARNGSCSTRAITIRPRSTPRRRCSLIPSRWGPRSSAA